MVVVTYWVVRVIQRHLSPARLALALELRTNPTKSKLSRQICSELRGQIWQQTSEAGGIEIAGSVFKEVARELGRPV